MKNVDTEIKRINRHMGKMVSELAELANEATFYARYSCSYIDQLSPVCYTTFIKAYKHINPKGLSKASFCNSLIKGMITKKSKSFV